MKAKRLTLAGLFLIIISQLLMSFGYDFLMSQRPIDFAHWALLVGAILLFGLWSSLPNNFSKNTGLAMMSLGIGGIAGMCTIDFILWAANSDPELKGRIFDVIASTPSIKFPFLMVGPTLFYAGICIATYGLFNTFKWQVACVNIGALMIGLGHMILGNPVIPLAGSALLFIGLLNILKKNGHQVTAKE